MTTRKVRGHPLGLLVPAPAEGALSDERPRASRTWNLAMCSATWYLAAVTFLLFMLCAVTHAKLCRCQRLLKEQQRRNSPCPKRRSP